MNNFVYHIPTKVCFGKDTENEAGSLLKEFGAKKALVHFGGGSVVKSGLLDKVCKSIKEAGIDYITLGGVVSNPRLSKVYEGVELGRKNGVDFILAVGGGSVIDSAKAIAYGIANEGDVWDFWARTRVPEACLPVGSVLTISAAGSEMSEACVITKDEGLLKRGYTNNLSRPKFAIMNPELTFTLPWYQVASGAVDILMHTLERWFDKKRDSAQLTDAISIGLMKTVMRNALVLKGNATDYNAAAELMWAGALSHNGLTGCGGNWNPPVLPGDWATHQLEHELGGMFEVAHGAGLSAVWGSWARYVSKDNPEYFAKLGKDLFGMGDGAAAETVIKKLEDFFVSIDMPVTIAGLGVTLSEEAVKELAHKCSFFGKRTIGSYRPLDAGDMEAIYRAAKG
ncbi:MAG: iron-containing alcohol dehydrogenase [Spirochaetes bacterium]|nr:iron-containing alcohol dehydrogenase [Spirochaetota bacterium]